MNSGALPLLRSVFLTIPVLALIQGCANEVPRAEAPQPFEFVDQRPTDEDSTQWLSRDRRSCEYTLRQMGDEGILPDRFTLLRNGLDSALHAQLTGKSLLVTHYAIYINNFERSRDSSFSMHGMLLSDLIQDAYLRHVDHRCIEALESDGRLEPVDVQTHRSPIIVEITLIVDGKSHAVRSLFTPERPISVKLKDPDTRAAVQNAVDKAIRQLTTQMSTP